jgi:NADPH:quinone reductase
VTNRAQGAMMTALLSDAPGKPETLRIGALPRPTPGLGQVRLKVAAAGLNFPDTLIIEDRYQVRPRRPFSPGIEVAGVIDAVGEGVDAALGGQRAVAFVTYGGIAEYVVAEAHLTARIGAGLSDAMAASLVVTYGTVWHALKDRARLQTGEAMLVTGASGGIGQAAVLLGKAFGATVIAAASSPERAEVARRMGADHTFVYPAEGADKAALTKLFRDQAGGRAFDVVCDPVGGVYGTAALRALAWGGRQLVLGFAAGLPEYAANIVLLKSADIVGVSWGEMVGRTPGLFARHMDAVFKLIEAGRLTLPAPHVMPLDRAADGIAAIVSRRAVGKTVVMLDQRSC